MRIYASAYELMSETGRNLWEMGLEVKPKTYQNKNIEGDDNFITKELTCEQYCLLDVPDLDNLFVFTHCKDWADAEFRERVSDFCENPGEAWKLRKDVWEQFLNQDSMFDYTYSERMYLVIPEILSLLREDPDTRKAVIPIFNGGQNDDTMYYDGTKRIPCSMYYGFLIRDNAKGEKQLNMTYHQRSSDFITHFGNDVYLAWKLMNYVAEQLKIKPGNLIHTIDSLHVYKKDWNLLKTSLGSLLK